MIKCTNCGTENLDGSQYCDECGTPLKAAAAARFQPPASPPPLPPRAQSEAGAANFQPQFSEMPASSSAVPAPLHASVTSVGIPIFVNEAGDSNNANAAQVEPLGDASVPGDDGDEPQPKGVHATLLIERGTSIGKEFQLTSDESYICRWDADNGIFPDVDLDAHDPEAKVSRRHARIIRENNRYALEDLGSTNGTFVNRGRRLIPGNRQLINDGDEIIVGKTFLRFHIV